MLLSFIIPLYNCEEYISHSLDSILGSQLPQDDYEIIVINDGSRDQGPEICQKYAKEHEQIRFITQKNKGASAARNAGIDIAQGDYIWFVDADDLIVPSFLSKAFLLLKEGSVELLCFNHQRLYTEKTVDVTEFTHVKKFSGIDYFRGHYCHFVWNKIYKVSSLKDIRYLDGTKNIEDMLFNMMVIIDIKHVCCVPEYGYQYNCTNNSSTSRNRNLRNLVKLDQDSMVVLHCLERLANKQTEETKKEVLLEELNFSISGHLYSLFRFYTPQRLQKRITDYRKMGLYPVKHNYSKKSNTFLLLANHDTLFVNIMRIIFWIKQLIR